MLGALSRTFQSTLLTNTLILARRTFAAVLGILDHGLAKEAQKLALFSGAKGRSH